MSISSHNCGHCGHCIVGSELTAFCPNCGKSASWISNAPKEEFVRKQFKRCEKCQKRFPYNYAGKFCGKCGGEVKVAEGEKIPVLRKGG